MAPFLHLHPEPEFHASFLRSHHHGLHIRATPILIVVLLVAAWGSARLADVRANATLDGLAADHRARAGRIDGQIAALRHEIDALRVDARQVDRARESLALQIQGEERLLGENLDRIRSLDAATSVQHQRRARLESQLGTLIAEREALPARIDALGAEVDAAGARQDWLKTTLVERRARLDVLLARTDRELELAVWRDGEPGGVR